MAEGGERGEAQAGTPPELSEQRFAENLRQAREKAGMSQVSLADQMAGRGWPWRQQTVARVENGQRMVRLGEALAIAEILGATMDKLTASTSETSVVDRLTDLSAQIRLGHERIVTWTQGLLAVQRDLDAALSEARASHGDSPGVRELINDAGGLLELTPEQAVEQARRSDEDDEPAESVIARYEQLSLIPRVIRAHQDNMSIRAISRYCNIPAQEVRNILLENGIKIRGRH